MRKDQLDNPDAHRAEASLLRGLALQYRNAHMPEFARDCERDAAKHEAEALRLEQPSPGLKD